VVAVVVPLLVPVVTGLVGAIGLMLKDRRVAHDVRQVREQAIAEATAKVGFATGWWQAQQLLGADAAAAARPRMVSWLAEAESTVTDAKRQARIRHNPVTVRRLLLMEPLHHRTSKAVRVLFWISATWLCVAAAVTAGDISSSRRHAWLGSDIALLVISAVIVLLLHIWAEASEHAAPLSPADATVGGSAPAAVPDPPSGTLTAS
jgi:hypothetical protein